MCRIAVYLSVLILLPIIACDPGGQAAAEAAAHPAGLGRAAALVDAPPETIPTVIRRVWGGPGAHFEVSPSPDGRFVSLTDWETSDLAVRNLETGAVRRVTHNSAPRYPGYAYYSRVSHDGEWIAYTWYSKESGLFELRVVDWNGSEPRVLQTIDWEMVTYGWSRDGRYVVAARMGAEVDPPELILVSTADGEMKVLESLGPSLPQYVDFSPDGRFIAYDRASEERPDRRDIYVLAVDGGQRTLVVNDMSDDYLLGWAPDGHILYCSDRTGTPGVWLLPVSDGRAAGEPQLVLPDAWGVAPVGFLEDGRYLYGVRTGGRDIYVATLSADLGSMAAPSNLVTARRLGSASYPAWSPDGGHLAYIRSPQFLRGPGRLVIRSMETGEVRELHLGDGLQPRAAPRWTPDGRSLVVLAGDGLSATGIFRLDLQSGHMETLVSGRLVDPGEPIDLSPDGHFLYYRSQEEHDLSPVRVYRKDLRNERIEEVYKTPVGWVWSIALSPDGTHLALLIFTTDLETQIVVLPAGGGAARELTPLSRSNIRSIAWTPDGEAILFSGRDPTTRTADVWHVPAAGGDPQRLGTDREGVQYVRLHPNGRQLAFTAGVPAAELWMMEDFLPGHRSGGTDDRED